MSCTLHKVKSHSLDQAMDAFQANARSIRLDKNTKRATIRWGNEFQIKTQDQARSMVVKKQQAVDEWAVRKFGKNYVGWVKIDSIDQNRIVVKFELPKSLERDYVIRLAQDGDQESIDKITKNPYYYNVPGAQPKNDETTFYQTENEKMRELNGLTRIIKRFFDQGIDGNKITLLTIEEYNKAYKDKYGKALDAVALSNIMENVVAFAQDKIDGTSLLEEAVHFIVYHLWDTGTLTHIKNGTDATGIRWIENSLEYQRNYEQYVDLYRDKLKSPNWAIQVEQEIVAKVITNFIYNNYKNKTYQTYNRFQNAILKFIELFKRVYGKVRNSIRRLRGQPEVNYTTDVNSKFNYTDEIKAELGALGDKFIKGTMNISTNPTSTIEPSILTTLATNYDTTVAEAAGQIHDALSARKTKVNQQLRQLFTNAQKKNKVLLEAKYSIKELDELDEHINTLLDLNDRGMLENEDKDLLKDLLELKELFTLDKEDREAVQKIKELKKGIDLLNSQIRAKQFQRGIKSFIEGQAIYDPTTNGYETKQSILVDIQDHIDKLVQFENLDPQTRGLAYPSFIAANDFHKTFQDVIRELGSLTDGKVATELFNGLSPTEANKLVDNIHVTIAAMAMLDKQLNTFWKNIVATELAELTNTNASGEAIFKDFDPRAAANDAQYDISQFTAWVGSLVDMSPWQLQSTIKTYSEVVNKVNSNVREKSINLLSVILDSRKSLENDKDIQQLMKENNFYQPEQLMQETINGKKTGYIIGDTNVGAWQKAQDEAADRILDKVEEFIYNQYAYSYKIPRGKDQASVSERGKFLYHDSSYLLPEDEKKSNPILNKYKELWAKWFQDNTKVREDIDTFEKRKRAELTALEYESWKNNNYNIYEDLDGNTHEYPAGELVVPNKKFRNKTFDKLVAKPAFAKILDAYWEQKEATDNLLPSYMTNSYEFRSRLPQISVDGYDILYGALKGNFGDLLPNLKEELKSKILNRPDDEISRRELKLNRLPSIFTPPIRFIEKLENPSNLTNDIMGAMVLYTQMGENYSQMSKALPQFEAIKESLKRSKFKDKKSIAIGSTNALVTFEKFINGKVYGQTLPDLTIPFFGYRISLTKLSNLLAKIKRDINLRANYGAMAAGYIDATEKLFIERMTQRNITKESAWWSEKHFFNPNTMVALAKEFEQPIKTHKDAILGQRVHLLDSNREIFADTDKSHTLNMVGKSLNYGSWRYLDYGQRMRIMLAIMDNYRFIDGKWYTRETWLEEGKSKEDWSSEENRKNSFYNKVTPDGKGGVKADKEITEAQWNFVTNRTKLVSRDIGGQASDLDGIALDHTLIGTWLLMHKAFLRLGLQKRIKPRHRNFISEKWEEGNFNVFTDMFFKHNDPHTATAREVLFHPEDLTPEQREGRIHTFVSIMWAHISFFLAVLMARAIDKDDDTWLQFIQYMALRNYQEATTFLGATEFSNMVLRPVPGVDMVSNFGDLIPGLLGENKNLRNSPYKTRVQKDLIKNTPILRGYYETFPLNAPFSNSKKALAQKKGYLDSKWANFNMFVPENLFIDFENNPGD